MMRVSFVIRTIITSWVFVSAMSIPVSGSYLTGTKISAHESQLVFAPPNPVPMIVEYAFTGVDEKAFRGNAPTHPIYDILGKAKDGFPNFYFRFISFGSMGDGTFFFNDEYDLKEYVNKTRNIETWSISIGESSSTRNEFNGFWKFLRFTANNAPCVAVADTFGYTPSTGFWTGNHRIFGHYCGEKDTSLTKSDIKEIGRSIGIRKIWLPPDFQQRLAAMNATSTKTDPVATAMARLSAKKLCSTALAGPNENKQWETTPRFQSHVNEAKSRGYSVADCTRHAGITIPASSTPSTTTETAPPVDTGTIEERLRKLKKLHDDGLIDEDAYKKKMNALLDQL